MKVPRLSTLLLSAAAFAAAGGAQAKSGQEILQAQCVACHAVAKPAKLDLERLWQRKGPDLYYAGVKFNQPWLEKWLQNPTTIRPSGVMVARSVKASADKGPDAIDPAALAPHTKLEKDDAIAVAAELMKLGNEFNLVEKGGFKNDPPNASMASLLFTKLRGCASCHSAKPGSGGISGPEMVDGGARLQPDYVVAYIKDPQKFDPHTWMPRLDLTDADVQKLTGYITTLKGEVK
ncbi:Cytochrome c [Cupriavidus sp. YR651]|uniref:c-type cytochrome n=1 Tax=Cupriavidus sp. YR651 TaxID=1855315 RepID=UPI00088B420B|nr:c-type cytochrome [Cupriavidus sp. YR651]SDC54677.1 Cytochrome c [Cupriavidus sp. YR651]